MVQTITHENRTRDWRGNEKVVTEEYTQIDGTVTSLNTDNNPQPMLGRTPILTIDAGDQTVTVAHIGGLATDMRPVQAGDTVRILATQPCTIADYLAATVERI
jgi:hypothetical protein